MKKELIYLWGVFLIVLSNIVPYRSDGPIACLYLEEPVTDFLLIISWWGLIIVTIRLLVCLFLKK